jgi:hypothetical protein
MRRYMVGLALAGAVAAGALASAAAGATPPRSRSFSGSGRDFWNHGSRWVRHGHGAISFKTSGPGSFEYVNQFHGTYTSACNSGTLYVKATSVLIHKDGTFGFHTKQKLGSTSAYIEVSGKFTGSGRTASVRYLVDFVKRGQHVKHPYDTSHPARLGCASWVKGRATG